MEKVNNETRVQPARALSSERGERNYGIDLLRVVSMFMVCVLHVLGLCGILPNVKFSTGQYAAAWFLEIACYGAVNCYALISGFVGYRSKFKLSNLAVLWLQVALTGGLIAVGFAAYHGTLQPSVLLEFLPIWKKRYWYFTAYFGLFFLMPILNAGINAIDKRVFEVCLVCLFILFSVVCYFKQLFQLDEGYSMLWLAYLYLVGGYIAKYKPFTKIKSRWLILFAICCILGTWILKAWKNRDFYGYLSPAHVLFAVALLELFSRIKITKGKGAVSFFASTSFGVYIIHTRGEIISLLRFERYAEFHPLLLLVAVLGTAVALYLACTLLDYLRLLLFKLIRVKPLLQNLENRIINLFQGKSHVSE